MTPVDLKVFNKQETDFKSKKEYKIICYSLLITSSALFFTGFIETNLSNYTFTIYESVSGSLATIGLIAVFCIKKGIPEAYYPRKFFDARHPLDPHLANAIATNIYLGFTWRKRSKCEFYSLKNSGIYFDYIHEEKGITVTSSLDHLFDSVSWKDLKLPSSYHSKSYISGYTGGDFYDINRTLRFGHISQGSFIDYRTKCFLYKVMSISSFLILNRSKKSSAFVLKRGISLPLGYFNNTHKEYFYKTHKVGNIIKDRAFWSTSSGVGFGGNVRYSIKKYFSGVSISHLSKFPEENEWLFPPNAKFKIIKMCKNKEGTEDLVELEEVI